LRSRTWFLDRPREIPLRLVRRWRQIGDRNGGFSLEEQAAIAADLSEGQLESLYQIVWEARLPPELIGIHGERDTLRLYASLAPAQRQRLWHGEAIRIAEMRSEQRHLFRMAVREPAETRPQVLNPAELADASFSMSRPTPVAPQPSPAAYRARHRLLPSRNSSSNSDTAPGCVSRPR
jgi:hypothetical protein